MVDNNTGFSKPATSKEPPSVCCSEETSPGSPLWGGGRGDGGGDREGGRRRRIRSESSQSWSRDRGGGTFGSRPHWSWSGPEMAFSPYSQQLIWGQNLNFEENLDGRLLSLGVSVVVGSPEDFTTLCHLTNTNGVISAPVSLIHSYIIIYWYAESALLSPSSKCHLESGSLMCERSSAWQRGNCLLLQYRLPVLYVVKEWENINLPKW